MTKKSNERFVYKDAETGEFVSRQYAQAHPKTTIRERIVVKAPAK